MTGQTEWASAVAILVSGLILGSMLIYFFGRRKGSISTDAELRDLEGKRDALVQQIRELVDTEAKLTPEQLAEEKKRLELEAADVLRKIDRLEVEERRPRLSSVEEKNDRRERLSSTAVGFVWGAASALALGGLVFFATRFATRREPAPPTAMQPAQPPADSTLQRLEANVQQQPENLDMRIELARAYLERDNLMGVFEQTQYVLGKSSDDSRALTYQALVRMAMGDSNAARQMLQHALRSDPSFLDAYVTMAWVQTQDGKVNEAEKMMQEAMQRHPEETGRLQQVLDQMKAHQGMATQRPPRAADSQAVHITLDIDAATKARAGANGVIYVVARPAGVTAGPPVAVKRLPASSFPLTFDLTSADSMMGQPLPASIRVEARLDSDGDAATKNPSDPYAAEEGVAVGSSITLTLK